ncbi:MAG: transcription elongation factor GreA [Flavobacteriales bacterium]|nr:transcription elongation factor GreA [Flavobacteriales bacterium]
MSKVHYMTQEGLEKIKKELEYLTTVERPRISQQIAEAREKGDLSENAEYDAAKEAQSMLELKISKLQEMVQNAKIVDTKKLDDNKVFLLSRVKIKNHNTQQVTEYTLVPPTEADFKAGKISVDSPIGKSLIGKGKGDLVEVKVPAGILKLEILEIGH